MEEGTTSSNISATPICPRVKAHYDEIFEVEMDGWCYGFSHFTGEISPALVHRVIKELAPAFRTAIERNYVFRLIPTAEKLAQAGGSVVSVKEIVFSMLANLPAPYELDEEGQFILAQIVDQAEQAYGGVLEHLERKWRKERKKQNRLQ